MVEPITTTIIIIVSIVSGIVMAVSGTIIIIKNGKDITDNIEEFFRSVGRVKLTINKASAYPAYAGVCKFFQDNKKQIKCKEWCLMQLPDSTGKQKSFSIPSAGRYIELEVKSPEPKKPNIKIVIHVIGDNKTVDNPNISGFVIYYKKESHLKHFINTALEKYIDKVDRDALVPDDKTDTEPVTVPGKSDEDTANLLAQAQVGKNLDDAVDQSVATSLASHHATSIVN